MNGETFGTYAAFARELRRYVAYECGKNVYTFQQGNTSVTVTINKRERRVCPDYFRGQQHAPSF
jgi:hypothetical protein